MSATSHGTRLLAVFPDEPGARSAAAALGEAGFDASISGSANHMAAVDAEMTEEATRAVGGPALPLVDREIAMGTIPITLVAAVVGALLTVPVALIAWPGSGTALIWSLVIGALAGGTFGFFAGGILSTRSVGKPLAAERGVTVSVRDSDEAREVLSEHEPIRIDLVEPDGATTPLLTERQQHPEILAERMGKQWSGHDREDEY